MGSGDRAALLPVAGSPPPPQTPSASRTVQPCLRCPFFALPMRGAAGSPTRGSVALRWGVGKLQSRFSTARLCCGTACGAEPSQPHALLPTGSRKELCLYHPLPLAAGSSPSPGPPRPLAGALGGERSAVQLSCSAWSSGCLLRPVIKKPLSLRYHLFFFFFFPCNCL